MQISFFTSIWSYGRCYPSSCMWLTIAVLEVIWFLEIFCQCPGNKISIIFLKHQTWNPIFETWSFILENDQVSSEDKSSHFSKDLKIIEFIIMVPVKIKWLEKDLSVISYKKYKLEFKMNIYDALVDTRKVFFTELNHKENNLWWNGPLKNGNVSSLARSKGILLFSLCLRLISTLNFYEGCLS